MSTNYLALRIGDTIPHTAPRGVQHGPEIAPEWYALLVPPQREAAARAFLRARDVYTFFPSEKRSRTARGKRIEWERPRIAGQVYAKFTQAPQWDIMKEKMRLITGVYCIGGVPVVIDPEIIRNLQGLTVEAEKLREAKEAMLRLKPGDKATLRGGPLDGFEVEVTATKAGRYLWRAMTGQVLGKPITGESTRDALVRDGDEDLDLGEWSGA